MTTWFTGDQHFFHENIIKYCQRPFSCIEEMNTTIRDRYCKLVHPDDEVWFLGDVTFYKGDEWYKFLQSLPGRKRLILGNHDRAKKLKGIFETIEDQKLLLIDGVQFYLSHCPHDGRKPKNVFHIHGHKHLKTPVNLRDGRVDVGVDGNDFYPWRADALLQCVHHEALAMQSERLYLERLAERTQFT